MDDKQFLNQFSVVLGVLIGIAVVILIIARILSDIHQAPDQAMQKTIDERIKPVGEVNVGTVPAAQQSEAAPQSPEADKQPAGGQADPAADPAMVYQTVCAVCHAAGIANAPIYGDKAAWATRIGDVEALYANSINGKGAMPAKGGRPDLSDETIKAAVDYMLEAVR